MENNKKKIDKKEIVKCLGVTALIVASLDLGIAIYDAQVDHTKEICPITRVMNLIPNTSYFDFDMYVPSGIFAHQMIKMQQDLIDKGIEEPNISYAEDEIIDGEETVKQYVLPTKVVKENGKVIYSLPAGYVLTQDENGQLVGEKEAKEKESFTGIHATWGKPIYDAIQDKVIYEGEVRLRTK